MLYPAELRALIKKPMFSAGFRLGLLGGHVNVSRTIWQRAAHGGTELAQSGAQWTHRKWRGLAARVARKWCKVVVCR